MTLSSQPEAAPTARQSPRGEVHRPLRIPLSLKTSVRADGGRPADIHLRNISAMGFMGETSAHLPAGTGVTVKLPGAGLCRATVRWSIGHRIGARFGERIDMAAVRLAAPQAFAE